jgi:hypothetical protein
MGEKKTQAVLLFVLFLTAGFSGCFGENEDENMIRLKDVDITPKMLVGGVFQGLTIQAKNDVSAFVPYLMKDLDTGFVYNSTVVDLKAGESVQLQVLAPPRADSAVILLGPYGRDTWPLREANESWKTWYVAGDYLDPSSGSLVSTPSGEQRFNMTSTNTDGVTVALLDVRRDVAPAYSEAEGGRHSTGVVNGRTTYNYLHHITDPSPSLDLIDGVAGYYDRWAGQGNVAYEDAAQYIIGQLESFGLEVDTQRYAFTDFFGNQNAEGYNICGFRYGDVYPNEWMVFGAHFDIAPPANLVLDDPHVTGTRTYGTRVGAYDNTAGTSMVLTVAEAMSSYDTRRTMVFCFWSGEEGGKRGSDYWTEYYVLEDNPDVTISNYVNLDMAGVNWPGGGGAPHNDPQPTVDSDGYPKDEEVWPMRVYIGPSLDHDQFNQPEMVGLALWIGADAIGVEEQQSTLLGTGFEASTWKVDDWLAKDRPEIIVYEDTTARSDHDSFQRNLGTVTMGFGGLVDGYWCYHQTCDTLEEMEAWMDTTDKNYGESQSGTSNLVNSLDMIVWWATFSFFHLDESPILNAYID